MTDIRTAAETMSRAQLAFDNPEAYIAGDRRRALAAGVELPDRVHGAALFADVSGFTPLTEALAAELGPQRGAEELTARLNRVFHSVIAELDRFGGDVIYFSGDAITCWLDGDDGCARDGLRARDAGDDGGDRRGDRDRLGRRPPRDEGRRRRRRRAPLRRRRPGDPADRRARRPPDRRPGRRRAPAAAGRGRAGRSRRSPRSATGWRSASAGATGRGRTVGVVDPAATTRRRSCRSPRRSALPEEVVREWLLPAVYERLRTGRGEFLAELRPAVALFVQFAGIDYDADDAVGEARRLRPPRAADLLGVRRQRAPDHDRRQGRLPLRRLRLAARARGRRRARRGRRARAEQGSTG